ncbi:site-2 protease family protein [Streptomyces enissocaesilis]|uniref:site-2 protease family protein n=1 Tax=Streptomyces TaxID=1883 RepID=UPI00249A8215|nr:site-2 protease family protein [Streptomyces sp. AN-3]MDI3099905.1 site-2 protease family protein [Streptomyces sp. AN-3]WDI17533.1 site-2 protease family protein [Streptomyces enissocaesilis]
MDVSGGSGQPRPGNDESAEPQAAPTAPATGSARPEPADSGPPGDRPADRPRTSGGAHGEPAGAADPTGDRSPAPGTDGTVPAPDPHSPGTGSPGAAAPDSGPLSQDPRPEPSPAGPSGADAANPESPGPLGPAPEPSGAETPAPQPPRKAPGTEPPGIEPPAAAPGGTAPAHGEPGRKSPGSDTPNPAPEPQPSQGPHPSQAPEPTPDPDPAPRPTPPRTHDHPAHPPTPAHPGHGAHGTRPDAHGTTPAQHARPDAHREGGTGPGRPPQRRPEPGGGLLMGRPFGVPVYVAPSWFLVAALITWVFGGQLDRVLPELGAARYLVSLFFAVAFYASVLVHELAHTVAALRFKLPVRRIQLQFFGGVSEIEKEAETPGREFMLAFVGPLLSLVLAGVFYAALLPVAPDSVPGVLLAGLMVSNLLVAAFNLLPGLPLDGGRMLRAVVWKLTGKPMSGTVAAAWVGRALAIAVLIGLPLLTQSLGSESADDVGMDTVLDALLAAILAAIIWTGAGNSLRMARLREHLPELRARALTRRAVPVSADTPLSEALRRANASGARALVVVDADGVPVSLVREAAIVGVPEHRRPWVPVSGLAQDLTDGMRVSAELSGEELLDALRANPATEYLVVEETGEIYGVLSAADVERAFVKAMARPS